MQATALSGSLHAFSSFEFTEAKLCRTDGFAFTPGPPHLLPNREADCFIPGGSQIVVVQNCKHNIKEHKSCYLLIYHELHNCLQTCLSISDSLLPSVENTFPLSVLYTMSMTTGLPYIGSPSANLTISDPRCNNDSCKAFYDAHQLSQKEVSYSYQFKYGHFVTWYYLTFIGLFTALYQWQRWTNRIFRRSKKSKAAVLRTMKYKSLAAWRFFAYRRVPDWPSNRFGLPSIGMLIFFLLAILYCSILSFAVRPYYREHRGYGSPPIAIRTGLMAVALTPLIIALSGKANLITLLTGISHEKLNIIHRWVAWLCFGLSVVHTVPFIVAPLRDGGYEALHKQYYKPGGFEYTGTPPLAILFGILLLSLPWIRHRAYETFYHLHFWFAVTYLGLMFWHAGQEGDSWVYLWATVAAWLMSILARAFWFTRPLNIMAKEWMIGSNVSVTTFTDDMTRLEVLAPADFLWQPGQHVYLRIPKLALFDNHPFTAASADASAAAHQTRQEKNLTEHAVSRVTPQNLTLLIRSHAGFTRRLRSYLDTMPDAQLEAWLEGPYGSLHGLATPYDNVVLVAGGGGISACLPWLEYFAQRMEQDDEESMRTKRVQLLWSIREMCSVKWVEKELERLQLLKGMSERSGIIEVIVHVTGGDKEARAGAGMSAEKKGRKGIKSIEDIEEIESNASADSATEQRLPLEVTTRYGRIGFAAVLAELPQDSRTVVIGKLFLHRAKTLLSLTHTHPHLSLTCATCPSRATPIPPFPFHHLFIPPSFYTSLLHSLHSVFFLLHFLPFVPFSLIPHSSTLLFALPRSYPSSLPSWLLSLQSYPAPSHTCTQAADRSVSKPTFRTPAPPRNLVCSLAD